MVSLIVAIAIDLCAFASAVVIAVDQNSHEEKVCKIRDKFEYMEIIDYMLDLALSDFSN